MVHPLRLPAVKRQVRAIGLSALVVVLLSCNVAAGQAFAKKKLVAPVAGRLHLAGGTTRPASLQLVECDKVRATSPEGVETIYTTDEVSSFVAGVDSFTVLRDFYVTLGKDAEAYNSSFMRVCIAGAGLELYEFRGMVTRTEANGGMVALTGASMVLGAVVPNVPVVYGGGRKREHDVMTTAWLLRREGNPRWLTLPYGARNLREVIEPLIADDRKLAASVQWGRMAPKDVAPLLSEYVVRKTANK
jgi:hypothetical protein